MCLKKTPLTDTHTLGEKEILLHGFHHAPPSVFIIPVVHCLSHPAVAMVLVQPLWYPGYSDTLFTVIGYELYRGGYAQE